MTAPSARILTVILNYRTAEMTLRAARAARTAMEGIEGAITIVDNDSQDGSFERLVQATADWPGVRVLASDRNGGFGAGNNLGIRAGLPGGARPDFIYLLNSDAFPEPEAIRLLRDHLLVQPDCAFVGGAAFGEDGAPHVTAFRFPTAFSEFEGAANTGLISRALRRHRLLVGMPETRCPVDWCAGATIMFRNDALDRTGLFDEDFFLYFEETDLCHRIWAAGFTGCFLPQSRVTHIGSASTGAQSWRRVPDYWFESRARYFHKRGGALYLIWVTLAHFAGATIWRTRMVIERKEDRVTPHFLRDLARQTWRFLKLGGTGARAQRAAPAREGTERRWTS